MLQIMHFDEKTPKIGPQKRKLLWFHTCFQEGAAGGWYMRRTFRMLVVLALE